MLRKYLKDGMPTELEYRPSDQQELALSAFVLARIADASGEVELADELLESLVRAELTKSLTRPELEALLSRRALLQVTSRLYGLGIDRLQIAASLGQYVELFPDAVDAPRAQRLLKMMAEMAAEDTAHAEAQPHRDASDLSDQQRIKDLVFQLRNQAGQPMLNKIFAHALTNDPRGDQSPGHQLVEIGWPAVPALIDAIDSLVIPQ